MLAHVRGINYSLKSSLFAVVCSHVLTKDKRKSRSPGLQRKKDYCPAVTALDVDVLDSSSSHHFLCALNEWVGLFLEIGLRAFTTTTPGYFRVKQSKDFGLFRYFNNTNSPKQRTSSGYIKTSKKTGNRNHLPQFLSPLILKNFY